MSKKTLTLIILGIMITIVIIGSYFKLLNISFKSIIYLLYFVLFAFLLKNVIHDKKDNRFFYARSSFVMMFLFVLASALFIDIYPFGDRIFSTVDLYSQYTSFISGYQDRLLQGKSLVYASNIGLGNNYIALFAYYLASPLNILMIVIPKAFITEGIFLLIALKLSLAAFTFTYYLQYEYKVDNRFAFVGGLMYAGMIYFVSYSWNIMWLDCFYLFPVVLIGYRMLMRGQQPWLYLFALAIMIFSNYYISFMICIFLGLHFIFDVIFQKEFNIRYALRFVLYSFLAVGLVSFLLLPTYQVLKLTSAANEAFPKFKFKFDVLHFLANHFVTSEITVRSKDLPNVATSTLALLFFFMFLFNKRISFRIKGKLLGLLILLAMSLWINQLDIIWHGFHEPNDLPYRYSFLYAFVMVVIVILQLQYFDKKSWKYGFLGIVLCLLCGYFKVLTWYMLLINFVLLTLYMKVTYHQEKINLLIIVITLELLFVSNYRYYNLANKEGIAVREDSYVSQDSMLVYKVVDQLKKNHVDSKYEYKVMVNPVETLNPGAMFGYNGITSFTSTNYYQTTKFMHALGYASNGVNSYLQKSFVAPMDSLLSTKYYISSHNLSNHKHLKKIDEVERGAYKANIYENKEALSLGFVANQRILEYQYYYYNPIRSVNSLYHHLLDMDQNLLEIQPISSQDPNVTINGDYSFKIENPLKSELESIIHVKIKQKGQSYIYIDCRSAEKVQVQGVNQWSVSPREPYFIDNSIRNVGDDVKVTIKTEKDVNGNIFVVTLNEDAYQQAIQKLKQHQLQIDVYKEDMIKAHVESNGGVVFTRIPYDKGWNVYVEDQPVETFAIGKGLLGYRVPSGHVKIKMQFIASGLKEGLWISGGSLCIVILLATLQYKKKKMSGA